MKFHPQVLDPSRAGRVTRYHTWSRIREQSVAEHSWQLMRILLAVWPEVPRHVLVHALVHDVGEVAVGDIPYPVKRENAGLKVIMDAIEKEAHLAMCLPWNLPPPQKLAEEERRVFKVCELVEMFEWGLFEVSLGNRTAMLVATRCEEAARQMLPGILDIEIRSRVDRYMAKRNHQYEEDLG